MIQNLVFDSFGAKRRSGIRGFFKNAKEDTNAEHDMTAAGSLSTMKRVKTATRSMMGHERLSALVVLSVHSGASVDADAVLDVMAKTMNRSMVI